jgi:hypothetical protein
MSGEIDTLPGKLLGPNEHINNAKIQQILTGLQARLGVGEVADREISASEIEKLVPRVATKATLLELNPAPGLRPIIRLAGYVTASDGGEGFFVLDRESSAAADGGTIFEAAGGGRWIRVVDEAVNVRWFVSSGSGTAGDPWIVESGLANYRSVHFPKPGHYQCDWSWSITGSFAVTGVEDVQIKAVAGRSWTFGGTLGTETVLTAPLDKGRRTIDVANSTGFAAGDLIRIKVNHNDSAFNLNGGTRTPGEINRIESVDGNMLTLTHPLSMNYPYDTEAPFVTRLVNPFAESRLADLALKNITVALSCGVGLKVRALSLDGNRSFTAANVRGLEVSALEVTTLAGFATENIVRGLTFCSFFETVTGGTITGLQTYGSQDSVRLWGCAGIDGVNFKLNEGASRDIWVAGSEDCTFSHIVSLSNQDDDNWSDQNREIWQLDNSSNVTIRKSFAHHPNKKGSLGQVFESRSNKGLCVLEDSTLYGYGSNPLVVKLESAETIFRRNKFYTQGRSVFLEGVTYPGGILRILDNDFYEGPGNDSGVDVLAWSTTATLNADYGLIEIVGNRVPQGSLVRFGGSSITELGPWKVDALRIENNSVPNPSAPGPLWISGENFPVRELVVRNNRSKAVQGHNVRLWFTYESLDYAGNDFPYFTGELTSKIAATEGRNSFGITRSVSPFQSSGFSVDGVLLDGATGFLSMPAILNPSNGFVFQDGVSFALWTIGYRKPETLDRSWLGTGGSTTRWLGLGPNHQFYFRDNAATLRLGNKVLPPSEFLGLNAWVFVWAGNSILIYRNGGLYDTLDVEGFEPTRFTHVGRGNTGDFFSGGFCRQFILWNLPLSADEIARANAYDLFVPYAERWANGTLLTSGSLVKGKRYRINTYVAGDDFENIGGTNESGSDFIATGTTATVWTNESELVLIGAVCSIDLGPRTGATLNDESANSFNFTLNGTYEHIRKV